MHIPANPQGLLNSLFSLRRKTIFSNPKGTLKPSVYHKHPKSPHLELRGFHWTGRV